MPHAVPISLILYDTMCSRHSFASELYPLKRNMPHKVGSPYVATWSPLLSVASYTQAIVHAVSSIKWVVSLFKMVGGCSHSTLAVLFI